MARASWRLFLLSPAHCDGERARLLLSGRARFPLAERLRDGGATVAEVFAFLSALYFRGKLAYAREFTRGPIAPLAITPCAGLVPVDARLTVEAMRALAACDVRRGNPAYEGPLKESAHAVARLLGRRDEVVLLGSVATEKYTAPLGEVFGARLRYPTEFVGRGDMSRGALLLRSARAGQELAYREVG